ncbi:MAG: oligosaccharide flippase family protein [bacterium]|nr:oligosaccharide flippase family protein [bacterium]
MNLSRAWLEGAYGSRLLGPEAFALGLTRGLRTLDYDGMVGDRLVRWNLEQTRLLPGELLGLYKLGVAVFQSGGAAWRHDEARASSGPATRPAWACAWADALGPGRRGPPRPHLALVGAAPGDGRHQRLLQATTERNPMRAPRYVAKNALLMTVGLFAGRILAFLIFRRMTGTVGVEGMGVWGLSVDLTSIILTVSTFGLTTLITREIIKDHADTWPIFWAAFRIRLLLGFATYALLAAYVFATGYDGATRAAVMLMAVGVLLESTGLACDSVLQAHEKVEHSTWSQLVSAAVYFALAWWWLDAGFGVMGVVWANVAGRAARLVIVLPLMVRIAGSWRGAASARRIGMRWMLRLGLPLFMATTFGIISYKIDTVIIMEMLGKLAAGVYTIGHRPLDLLLIVPYLFAAALFPSLMRYREQERDGETGHVERMGERALRYQHPPATPTCRPR